jgi:hypothetical protein
MEYIIIRFEADNPVEGAYKMPHVIECMESDEIGPKQSLENLLPVLKGAEQFE